MIKTENDKRLLSHLKIVEKFILLVVFVFTPFLASAETFDMKADLGEQISQQILLNAIKFKTENKTAVYVLDINYYNGNQFTAENINFIEAKVCENISKKFTIVERKADDKIIKEFLRQESGMSKSTFDLGDQVGANVLLQISISENISTDTENENGKIIEESVIVKIINIEQSTQNVSTFIKKYRRISSNNRAAWKMPVAALTTVSGLGLIAYDFLKLKPDADNSFKKYQQATNVTDAVKFRTQTEKLDRSSYLTSLSGKILLASGILYTGWLLLFDKYSDNTTITIEPALFENKREPMFLLAVTIPLTIGR